MNDFVSKQPHAPVVPGEVCWVLLTEAAQAFAPLRDRMGEETYQASKKALQEHLCRYFSASKCATAGLQINPMGGTDGGGKCFKVRWAMPGCGKSGGLRIAVVAYCDDRRVVVCDAWERQTDPTSGEFAAAFESASKLRREK